jgi:steroid delta-isomerase-like uncharacterized protein
VKGAHEFLPMRAALLDALPDMRVTVDELIASGDHVALRWTVSATHAGGGFGFPASQKPVAFRGMTWLRFENGAIVEGWDSWNQGGLFQQLQAAQAEAVPA